MKKISILDCTLRDGGYVNNFEFGFDVIRGYLRKIATTGIEYCEVGFIKDGVIDNPDINIYSGTKAIEEIINPKNPSMKYVGMIDMSSPVPLENILPKTDYGLDLIRVIFKKSKIKEALKYCEYLHEMGYEISVNYVGTDSYNNEEFVEAIKLFNKVNPEVMAIVDSFGVIKRKRFLEYVRILNEHMNEKATLGYHAHNNLQQAMGNAESLLEMNINRELIIDACVFGMGRGAGNLNLELFSEYMNENYDTHYKIEPMLEIMDEYLNDIYKTKFWGYSIPLYLSASLGCHPNYAIYFGEKESLTVKSFSELLKGISEEDKALFSKEKAEKYYRDYQEIFVDDKKVLEELSCRFKNKKIIIIAPGETILSHSKAVKEACEDKDSIVIALNFDSDIYNPNFIFSSNMRRYNKIMGKTKAKCITTSNMKDCTITDYVVNFASYALDSFEIIDNSGLMLLNLLVAIGIQEVYIAGMDGYSMSSESNYYDKKLEYDFSKEVEKRNLLIKNELDKIGEVIKINFITPTKYSC